MVDTNRRDFLKGLRALGLTPAITSIDEETAQVGDITYNPNEEVTYVAGWSNEFKDGEVHKDPMYKTMTHEEWDELQATDQAAQELTDLLNGSELEEKYIGIIESAAEENDTGDQLEVTISSDSTYTAEEIMGQLPATVSGEAKFADEEFEVPVDVREVDFEEHSFYSEPYTQYNDVPGAAPIISPDTPDYAGCTAGPFFHERNGEAYMVGVIKGTEDGLAYATTAETTEDVLSGNWLTQ